MKFKDDTPRNSIKLFIYGFRLNHSCVPNAEDYYKLDYLNVRALKDIRFFEEITVFYIYYLFPQAQRQELLSRWRFICQYLIYDIHHLIGAVYEMRRTIFIILQLNLL
jgi:hypothetical protein